MRKQVLLLLLPLTLCLFLSACQKNMELPPLRKDDTEELESMSLAKSKIQYITNNRELYPKVLVEYVERNPELIDFVFNYPEKKGIFRENIDRSSKYKEGEFPLFMQWDKDWGYAPYGQSVIGLGGCGPTCLSMVYVGLTGDISYNPQVIAKFSKDNGYYDKSNDVTLWTLMSEGAKKLGLESKSFPWMKMSWLVNYLRGTQLYAVWDLEILQPLDTLS